MKLKISIRPPVFPEGSGIELVSTSWQIGTDINLDDINNLVVDEVEDTINKLRYEFVAPDNDTTEYYCRMKMHFSNGNETTWSSITPIAKDQKGFIITGTVVETPILFIENATVNKSEPFIHIMSKDFKLIAGAGQHDSTSWYLKDTNGKIILESKRDKFNKTSIDIPSNLIEVNKMYVLTNYYHTDTGATSKAGTMSISITDTSTSLYNIVQKNNLMPDRHIYFNLSLKTSSFVSVDLKIEDALGTTIVSKLDQDTLTPSIYTGNLNVGTEYTVKSRIRITDDKYTPWITVNKSTVFENVVYPIDEDTTYLNKYTFEQGLLLNGLTVFTANLNINNLAFIPSNDPVNDNVILTPKEYKDGKFRYLPYDNIVLENVFNIADVNIIHTSTGRVLLNYAIGEDGVGGLAKSRFELYEFNTINGNIKKVYTFDKADELDSTALTNSLVIHESTNQAYYIPRSLSNGANLEIRSFNVETGEFTNSISLAGKLDFKTNISMCRIDKDNVLLLGGSLNDTLKLENRDIYTLNLITKEISLVGELPLTVSEDIYALLPVLRKDGKVMLFNNSEDGPSIGNQDTIVIDLLDYSVEVLANDMSDEMRYNGTVVIPDGDIIRVSSRIQDPQVSYRYISDTTPDALIIESELTAVEDLVIGLNEVITIDNILLYRTIKIEGTSPEDTGLLKVVIDGELITFDYLDILVPNDTVNINNLPENPITDWRRIVVLNDSQIVVTNYTGYDPVTYETLSLMTSEATITILEA